MLFFRFDRGGDLGGKNRLSRVVNQRYQLSDLSINILKDYLKYMTKLLLDEKNGSLIDYILWSLEHTLRLLSWVGIDSKSCNDSEKVKLSLFRTEIEPILKNIMDIKTTIAISPKRRFFNTLIVHAPDEYYERHGQT